MEKLSSRCWLSSLNRTHLTWENSEEFVLFKHQDEEYHSSGAVHRIDIFDIGTILELRDSSHESSATPYGKTRHMSGITKTIKSVDAFEQWWPWYYRGNIKHDGGYVVNFHGLDKTKREKLDFLTAEAEAVIY